ncbi:hypothetical protein VTJ49DRAFT_2121 [Mycothermus thermophilus]|uniref:Gamma interferon inducible lysosomal thiol reductase n=1 Tax=Humicola insolens TaxID=85995 RepID=A0ABR3VP08_HUMIN
MDEKHPTAPMLLPSRRGLQPLKLVLSVAAYLSLAALLYCSFGPRVVLPLYGAPVVDSPQEQSPKVEGRLVPLEAHIMSKCPDAKDCLRDLVLPAMQKVHDKVNFTLSFIGKPTENDGVACMHGPEECLGNIIELCAQHLYPDPKTFLGFTMCLTRDYAEIPQRELIEDCALEHAIDFERLNECATKDNSAFGIKLLRESVNRTAKVYFISNLSSIP